MSPQEEHENDHAARVEAALEAYYAREARAEGSTRRDREKARTLARKAGRRRKGRERGE
jgi:hypothetical protein